MELTPWIIGIVTSILISLVGWAIGILREIREDTENLREKISNLEPQLIMLKDRQHKLIQEIIDLHEWHKPDSMGRQTWKDTGPVLDRLRVSHEQLSKLCDLIERSLRDHN